MSIQELIEKIQDNIEWMETIEGDDVECISVENLEAILSKFLSKEIKLTLD